MGQEFTAGDLKEALQHRQWDRLDLMLELDPSQINHNSLFSDAQGCWWGLLYECILLESEVGVRILLAHGADPHLRCWGRCPERSPLELARERQLEPIARWLEGSEFPPYRRAP